ncbi:urease accessory protein UreF [Ammoniphilus sp. YIM 78166]|uniref:urease accessory protein UreF n=1 Tax=Ammoniphilus sp. YIM 78166 TaxID=1644106 RepID=UPI00106F502F|nr:urease accessory protein UreF [Ammoniphilus sp. YIM 78166]
MDRPLLTLLQLCDSNFPSGAFSHSFGLETYIQEEAVVSRDSFGMWLRAYLSRQLVYTDGLGCRLAYEALEQGVVAELWSLDEQLTVQNIPRESREASRRMGERLVRLGWDLFQIPLLEEYLKRIKAKASYGHPSVAFAIIAHHVDIAREQALLAFLYSNLASLVQNGVRGIPLGQTDGQRLLLELQPKLLEAVRKIELLDKEDLGAVSPGLELAQMRHERLHVRLFMS